MAINRIVYTKMKILSPFTHPQVVPNLYECLCSAEHKGRYSEECGKQSSSGAPLTSIVFFFLLWKSMVPQNSLITNFLQNIFLCVQQNKDIHTGLEGELLTTEFSFLGELSLVTFIYCYYILYTSDIYIIYASDICLDFFADFKRTKFRHHLGLILRFLLALGYLEVLKWNRKNTYFQKCMHFQN